jgi:hypothetical protein
VVKRPAALRALLWLAVFAVMLVGAWLGDANISAAAALLVLLVLGIFAPRALHPALATVALGAGVAFFFGGARLLIDLLPAFIAGMVAWIFARTLLPGRRPLIARAIAAIDGEEWLAQPPVARYGRDLTGVWAIVQTVLLLLGCACALHARGIWPALWLPAPRVYAALVLPGIVALTFLLEFVLRPALLPSAPRHSLTAFLRKLALSWPHLLE